MIKNIILKTALLSFAGALLLQACRKRDNLSSAENYVTFETNAQGISAAETSLNVIVKLSFGTDKAIPLTLKLTGNGVTYGTDFTTTPAATNGELQLTIPQGNNQTSFTVTKVPGVLFDGDESVSFELYSSGSPVLIGTGRKFTLSFAELVSASSSFMIEGGGATYPNRVFIDLSANRQTPIQRTDWDLGFFTSPSTDSFYTILNSSTGMMAKQLAKNDLNTVSAADTVGFYADVAYSAFAPVPSQMAYVDYPTGDLSKTAITKISATATDNKVYIVNRGLGVGTPAPARGWKKIRVLRNATGGYTLQYADIAATSFSSIDIPKDESYFFKYISFDNGAVSVEPQKKKWDIAWTYGGYLTNFGGGEVPYLFQDLIIQNRNVAIAKVLTSTKAFADFNEASLTDGTITTWNSSQVSIGSDWRRTTPSPADVYTDRYYIVRDGDNNYYKIRFTALTNNGVRGYPSIAYELVKKGL